MNSFTPINWIEENEAATQPASWPRITKRKTAKISPWVDLVAREVEFSPNGAAQIYHSIAASDYVIVLAVTPDDRIPVVRQYRPAVEGFTLELPGGTIDAGEDPATTASRELLEETGLPSQSVQFLGVNRADAGRLGNRVHSYFVRTEPQVEEFKPEDGIAVRYVTIPQLMHLIQTGELDAQANLGTVLLALLRGCLKFSG